KRIGEGDTGLNTGGMGAVSPVPFVDEIMLQKVKTRIIEPTIQGLKKRQMVYKGFIFFGLIEVNGEPFVIEYNCRMGDPETEVVMPRLKSDLMQLLLSAFDGSLATQRVHFDERAACTVMLVSGGYPGSYEKGKDITGFDQVKDSLVFHAGTRLSGQQVLSNGGRVLAITSYGPDFTAALQQSYTSLKHIRFDKMHYRRDIGFDLA
ncbi:MAG: phosphoribosylamine--glycine ligase, partial [Phaeodactylibacter sp.]|nr:phosphoribosylamine--glycine ligase [Phaeodactylibacter sp.]